MREIRSTYKFQELKFLHSNKFLFKTEMQSKFLAFSSQSYPEGRFLIYSNMR